MNELSELDDWIHGHKSRSASITHDNGYGSHGGWEVILESERGRIELSAAALILFDDDLPSLGVVIREALRKFEYGNTD